ncbi:hypothetical protein [Phaeocystidibacter luteus]|uniref:Uncharacterized protein n=1 Tax=Phaeocystidibacter luteus TaxID=911197 RepID=A0A6N6RLX0_9FLAO|nr:hypothetical protein [Phaeocystidibacter luteus]KAB2814571.1 hypothetical protein F8C67_02190 [Phaeocystidibacter luteus]
MTTKSDSTGTKPQEQPSAGVPVEQSTTAPANQPEPKNATNFEDLQDRFTAKEWKVIEDHFDAKLNATIERESKLNEEVFQQELEKKYSEGFEDGKKEAASNAIIIPATPELIAYFEKLADDHMSRFDSQENTWFELNTRMVGVILNDLRKD